ncbi:hypothetical protein GCM10010313_29530 [Streptomyces violarus]|nr:hypothetical protein GCM10010313_29530 [Streptomyces violarus]
MSGSLPEPPPQAVRADAARARATRGVRAAVGRTGTTSYGRTSLWPGRLRREPKLSGLVRSMRVRGFDPGW